jgi:hypothetical protein
MAISCNEQSKPVSSNTQALPNGRDDDESNCNCTLCIELVSFTVTYNSNTHHVVLDWITLTEVNIYGFFIQKGDHPANPDALWPEIAFIPGHGTTTETHYYHYEEDVIDYRGGCYDYRLRIVRLDGCTDFTESVNNICYP